jgi:hypothetical protein
MFTVKCGKVKQTFDIWEDAKAFAEKASWDQNAQAVIFNRKGDAAFIRVP